MAYHFRVVGKHGRVIVDGITGSMDKLDQFKNEWYVEEEGNRLEEVHDEKDLFKGYVVYL